MADASARAHQERMGRSIPAVREYLEGHLPDCVIETDKRDIEHHYCTFAIEKGNDRRLLRVADEVLDLDADGIRRHLRDHQIARRLREDVLAGQALLVRTDDIHVESIGPGT